MSNTTSNIKNSWSLVAFASKFERFQVGDCTNKETGEKFTCCIFSEGDSKTFVSFSPKLGALSPKEIASQKDDLQIVEWDNKEKGTQGFTLCSKGSESWQDVIL